MSNSIVTGRIYKAIAGFFYVNTEEGMITCHAKGILRRGSYRPLVGDNVTLEIIDFDKKEGSILSISERVNSLIRPEVANIDNTLIVFAYEKPKPNLLLLDRFIVSLEMQGVQPFICFNKLDIAEDVERQNISDAYTSCGFKVFQVSAINGDGIDELKSILSGKITAFAGPSGVGKSSLINLLCPAASMETGTLSEKTGRGKHTTRHSEIFESQSGDLIVDTPGFTSLELLNSCNPDSLKSYYKEFYEYEGGCSFSACSHTHEPGCAVKDAMCKNEISRIRYDNYLNLYNELKNQKNNKIYKRFEA